MFKHILVPLDGSELAERAAEVSLTLAARLGAHVTAFICEPLPPLPTMASNMSALRRETDAHEERAAAHARATLARFAAQAEAAGVACDGQVQRTDAVGDAIVNAAREFDCDLIVMTTHGRGAFGELMFGSHTKSVLAKSKLPLLVLH